MNLEREQAAPMSLEQRLARAPVVPLIQAEDADIAVHIAKALAAGGLAVVEVVLRTGAALHCTPARASGIGQE